MIRNTLKKLFIIKFLLASLVFYGQQEIKHAVFIAGPQFTGILDEQNKEVWNSGKPGARDGYVLPNGNLLICWADEVKEFNKKKEVIFSYHRPAPDIELGTACRLKNGNTLISISGKMPRLIEVNKKGLIKIAVPLQPETENVHMQTRMARKLDNGNYLVPHLLAFAVKEYTANGTIVNVFKTDIPALGTRQDENWPFSAIRLENKNTLVSLTHGNKVVEFDPEGKITWKVDNEDLNEDLLRDPCGVQRLANGNTVIASYGATSGVKLFEITPEYKVVWRYVGFNVHEFQILTTNGKPEKGKLLK